MRNRKMIFVSICFLLINIFTQFSVFANEQWQEVKTKNFTLIGNANEADITNVGIKLEQFREAIKRLDSNLSNDSPLSTTVIVFKDKAAFHKFKPLNSKGQITDWVAGYFQAGFDKNYIALSYDNKDSDVFQTIFHEYTHNLIDYNLGRSSIPVWFSEGLSEYYDQFDVREDRIVKLGGRNQTHLQLLKECQLIPFDKFFQTDQETLRVKDQASANLFYAQAWALMHYFIRGEDGNRKSQLDKFIKLISNKKDQKEAFTEAFQMSYSELEIKLLNHVKINNIDGVITEFEDKLTDGMKTSNSTLTDAELESHLGDLLYQRNRFDEAEKHLLDALKLDTDISLANSTLGLIRLKQKNLPEAKKYLKRASLSKETDYLTFYRYAYFLSREHMTINNYIAGYSDERALEMRSLLNKVILLNPNFPDSYRLLGFINLVRNEKFDESIEHLRKALRISPNQQVYLMTLAQLYLRKNNFEEANSIAKSIADNPDDQDLEERAKDIIEIISNIKNEIAKAKENGNKLDSDESNSNLRPKAITQEELERNRKQTLNEVISESLRKPDQGEVRIVGQIANVTCLNNKIIFTVLSEKETKHLQSDSFEDLLLKTFTTEMSGGEIGCGINKTDVLAVLIYNPSLETTQKILGDIVSIEFVPNTFELAINP